ncbi:hypothetical protein D3C76_1616070 [compost metagenome]
MLQALRARFAERNGVYRAQSHVAGLSVSGVAEHPGLPTQFADLQPETAAIPVIARVLCFLHRESGELVDATRHDSYPFFYPRFIAGFE